MLPNQGPGNRQRNSLNNPNSHNIPNNHSSSRGSPGHRTLSTMSAAPAQLSPADARALALHLQHLQQLQSLQQQHAQQQQQHHNHLRHQQQQQQQQRQQQTFLSEALGLAGPFGGSYGGQGAAFAVVPAPAPSMLPPLGPSSCRTAAVGGGSHVNALMAAAAEKLATDAALAACLSGLGAVRQAQQQHQQQQQQQQQEQELRQRQQQQIEFYQLRNLHRPLHQPQHQPTTHHVAPGQSSEPSSSANSSNVSKRSRSDCASGSTPPAKRPSSAKAAPDEAFPSERESVEVTNDACPSPESAVQLLRTLGTTLRSKADRFVDVAQYPVQGAATNEKRRGASVFFPEILYQMLLECDRDRLSHIISFLPHGRAFRVHNKVLFEREVLPRYFLGQTKWSSFSRQLNLYGFLRITTGTDYGAYYHELFLRGRPDLHNFMRRVGKPHGLDRRKHKLAEGQDPNLYDLPPVPTAVASAAAVMALAPMGDSAAAPM